MKDKRAFARAVLERLKASGRIFAWESSESRNRHDLTVAMPDGRIAVIEMKGCLDGNNTTIFERPANAHEFLLWSVCTNPASDPRRNVWSGVHVRLSADIVTRGQRVDGLIVWDWLCGSFARPCPKADGGRWSDTMGLRLPPPCLYLFPDTLPHPRHNTRARAQPLRQVSFLAALGDEFGCIEEETFNVSIETRYQERNVERKTVIERAGVVVAESAFTPLQRA